MQRAHYEQLTVDDLLKCHTERTSNSVTDITPSPNGLSFISQILRNETTENQPSYIKKENVSITDKWGSNDFPKAISLLLHFFLNFIEYKKTKEITRAPNVLKMKMWKHLDDDKWTETVNWFALLDHKRQVKFLIHILIQNGPTFKIPPVLEPRGLIHNNLYNVRSRYTKRWRLRKIIGKVHVVCYAGSREFLRNDPYGSIYIPRGPLFKKMKKSAPDL
uniref:Uncharacterized protein n=1 Tax=Wuchereria bancrofti TaxID=6293 RepID=A0AAF5PGS4_WUCBA